MKITNLNNRNHMAMIKNLQTWLAAPVNTLGKNDNDPVVKSTASYGTYLNNAVQNILNCPNNVCIPQRYNIILNGKDCLDMTEGFICHDDLLFALSTAELVLKYVEDSIAYHKEKNTNLKDKNYKGLRDSASALRGLLAYLKSSQIWIDKKGWNTNYNVDQLNAIRDTFRKTDIHKIDGNECLANARSIDFIKLAVENSFFFDAGSAKSRHEEIVDSINNSQELPARWSTDPDAYNQPVQTRKAAVKAKGLIYRSAYPVKIDGNGNAQVKALMSKYTGYTVSGGVDSIFQSYKISHIWGQAYDPRYFTNLWNLVLVPAWANDLLDKDEYAAGASKLIIKLKSTFKAICIKHYGLKSGDYDFSILDSSVAPTHLSKAQRGSYLINVIGKRANGQKISSISKENVKV